MSANITMPAGAIIKLTVVPGFPGATVIVAPVGTEPDIGGLLNRPGVVGTFTHDPAVSWPDRLGCQLASAYLAEGHPLLLAFPVLADAIACMNRLKAAVPA